jgi:hypothetical protein
MSDKIIFCNNCYYVGKSKMKGDVGLLVFLLLLFFPAGLIYAVIMSVGNTAVCPECGNSNTLPYHSPRAKVLMEKHSVEFDDTDANFYLDEKKPWYKKRWVLFFICLFGIYFFFLFLASIFH